MFSVFFFPSASVCMPVSASISCWLVLEFSGVYIFPYAYQMRTAPPERGCKTGRCQHHRHKAMSACVSRGFSVVFFSAVSTCEGSKLSSPPTTSPMAVQYTTGINFTKTNRTE